MRYDNDHDRDEITRMLAEYASDIKALKVAQEKAAAVGQPWTGVDTAFPTTATQGMEFQRSDLGGKRFFYDGTYWLDSEQIVTMIPVIGATWPQTATNLQSIYTFSIDYDLIITGIYANILCTAVQNASNYYLLNFYNTQGGTAVGPGNLNTSTGLAANTWGRFSSTGLSFHAISANIKDISVQTQLQAGAPGNLTAAYPQMTIRRIVT